MYAAPHEQYATGAFVNAVSDSGNLALNVHWFRGGESTFSWRFLIKTVAMIWRWIVPYHLRVFEVGVLYDGVIIAQGWVVSIPPPTVMYNLTSS